MSDTQPDKSSPENSRYSDRAETGPDQRAAEEQLDFEGLLEPVSAEAPVGEDLKYDPLYDKIREARRADDAELPQGVWERELKKADWGLVRRICVEALTKRTKDLQIAAWLMEALIHQEGFRGAQKGLKLVDGLCRTFWEDIYPQPDEDDLEARLSPLHWISEKLSVALKFPNITSPQSMDYDPYTFSDWERANYLEQLSARDKTAIGKAEAQGEVTRAKFLGSVMFTSRAYYDAQYRHVSDMIGILDGLAAFLEEHCGNDGPSFRVFRDTLTQIQALIASFLREKETQETVPDEADEKQTDTAEDTDDESGLSKRPAFLSIRNRAEAYRMLSEAADYLMIHEPHSPTPYLVKRAVAWGHMTLTELLQELLGDANDLDKIYKLLGLKAGGK